MSMWTLDSMRQLLIDQGADQETADLLAAVGYAATRGDSNYVGIDENGQVAVGLFAVPIGYLERHSWMR